MDWLPKNTVLVPVDFSPSSLEAVRLGRTMVSSAPGLHVLHVLQPLSAMEPGVVWGELTDEKRVEEASGNLHQQLADPELAHITITVHVGSPGWEIADYAKEIGAELIVIPSHGYTGMRHLLLGSVAERVVRHAPCPVLVLRRNQESDHALE